MHRFVQQKTGRETREFHFLQDSHQQSGLCRRVNSVCTQLHFSSCVCVPTVGDRLSHIYRMTTTQRHSSRPNQITVFDRRRIFILHGIRLGPNKFMFFNLFACLPPPSVWQHHILVSKYFRLVGERPTIQRPVKYVVSSFNTKINCFQTIDKFQGALWRRRNCQNVVCA